MSRWTRLLIGLLAALAAGWIAHGPFGRGAAYLDQVEARAKAMVDYAAVPGVTVRMARDPMSRTAILSGPANDFQREGIGQLPGLNGRVAAVAGVSRVRWDARGGGLPLIAEMLGLVSLFYLIGVGIGWRFFRPRREGFL
ncbi:MAG TPA: hypothetical protein VEW71_06290 [Allosphingosinicella sp.]|nr:hypothetical protein [Allosphingosinicella sp.]